MGALNRGRRKELLQEPESREHHLSSGGNGESLQDFEQGSDLCRRL